MRKIILKNKKGGYTIIETMIAISLFLVIITTGMTALLNANVLHQKSQAMRSEMDNLSFVMEDMSRNLRTGSNYHCIAGNDNIFLDGNIPKSSPGGITCSAIAFEPSGGNSTVIGDQWVYDIQHGSNCPNNSGCIYKINPLSGYPGSRVQMTPDEISISAGSGFVVLGAESPSMQNIEGNNLDQQQPFMIIRLVGTITLQGVTTPFSIQTSVSQRLVDI